MNVIVVGGGVIGLCAAYYLRQDGHDVTVLDRPDAVNGGCSHGNGGIIVPSHFVPLAAPGMIKLGMRMMFNRESPFGFESLSNLELVGWIVKFMQSATKAHVARCGPVLKDLNLRSRALYEEMIQSVGISPGYSQRGLLMICETEAGLKEEVHAGQDAAKIGLKTSVLTARDLQVAEPDLEISAVGAVHFHDDAHLSPSVFMAGLRDWLCSNGVSIVHTDVTGLHVHGNKIATAITEAGEFCADEFVLAAGVWTGTLARQVGLRMPLVAGRGYGFTVQNPPQPMRHPAILTEARVAVTPMPDGIRFVGTMELGRPIMQRTSPRVNGMKKSISRAYPAFRPDVLAGDVWCGLRPCSPDGMPYLGRTKKISNMIVSAGHAMMGMSLGPVSGRLVADSLRGGPSIHELDPDRFA